MRYLGLDLGTKTLGISISETGIIANALTILKHDEDYDYLVGELDKIIKEKKIDVIVLGLPKNMNNTITIAGERVLKFKDKLSTFNIPVVLEDERLTTRVAQSILIDADVSRKKRKKVIDKMAASVILQSYLDKGGYNGRKEN